MADIANLKVGTNTYTIKDSTARTSAGNALSTANNADSKADQAIADSATATSTANSAATAAGTAQTTANSAVASASSANTKIDGAKIIGTYTSGTETLEVSLELGS